MRFVDLFAGLGGFHLALSSLGHECVFASEINDELREIYILNFPKMTRRAFGDIRKSYAAIPRHDILCAGFPCQPFSKSGMQLGLHDKIQGTLFDEIVKVLELHHPEYVILENVGNFERHDSGQTWRVVKEKLQMLGYDVRGTEHITSGGTGLISPHHFGHPHTRERFFVVAQLGGLGPHPLPIGRRNCSTSLRTIVQRQRELSAKDMEETRLTPSQIRVIEHWNILISRLPEDEAPIPSFPIWGDEFGATYPFEKHTPYVADIAELRQILNGQVNSRPLDRQALIELLPSYARTEEAEFPKWKVDFIRQNREWFAANRRFFPSNWVSELKSFAPSHRKFEWNCKGEQRDLWRCVLQFRPSGLRAKRYSSSPALVAMTATQIPILGPKRRFLTRTEGLRLQGFPDQHRLPKSREAAFQALGNAVHVDVVRQIAQTLLRSTKGQAKSRHKPQ